MIELESSLEEDSVYTQALWRVIESVKRVEKKAGVSCKFCEGTPVLETNKDYVVNYSGIVYCVVNHCKELGEVSMKEVFNAEMYLLTLMVDPENMSVYKAIKGGYQEYYNIRKTMGILSEEYYTNRVNELECEHDVESLSLMVYKKKDATEEDVESLLTVLYLRKEYTRFFRVFKGISPSLYEVRMALSLTLNEDCDHVLKDIPKSEVEIYITHNLSNPLLSDILTVVDLSEKNTQDWLIKAKTLFEWNEKVKIWLKNRNDCSGSVDKSMMEEAIKAKRWDDAWYISRLGSKGVKEDFHKSCILCIRALSNTKDELWVSRLLDIVEGAISVNKVDICCEIIDDLFDRIDSIDEQFRFTILKEFIRKVSRMEKDEKVVNRIIRVIGRLCRTCSASEACRVCVDHVNAIYSDWKKNNTGGFFFKTHSKYEQEIFENMLDLYCTLNDSGRFVGVCRDLVENEAKLNRAMCKCIQHVHSKTCPNCCEYSESRTLRINEGGDLLSHLFKTHSS